MTDISQETGPLTHAELFMSLHYPSFPREKNNWDNLSWDKGEFGKTGGVKSQTDKVVVCVQRCEEDEECVQWAHHDETCYLGMSFRKGYEREGDNRGPWTSGWNRTRVEEWLERQEECDSVEWPQQKLRLW